MGAVQIPAPSAGRPRVVGELVEYRPDEWLRAGAVIALGPELTEPGRSRGREVAAYQEEPGTPHRVPELTRLKVVGASEWWHSPHSVEALVAALAEATANARGGRP
jgi:hypothetical protein